MWASEARLYLLPWIALVAIVAAIPLIREAHRRTGFDAFSPVVFAVWTHVLPAFVGGGLLLAAGWQPWFFFLIPGADLALPATLFYASVGFAALTAGFSLPAGLAVGRRVAASLPRWHWTPDEVVGPALGLLVLAGGVSVLAYRLGLAGSPDGGAVGGFDAAIRIAVATCGPAATVLLWLVIFRAERHTASTRIALIAVVTWTLVDTLVSGRRAALLQAIILAAGAFWLSGRRVRARHAVGVGAAALVAAFVGIAYGTTFRVVQSSERPAVLSDYPRVAREAARLTLDRGLGGNGEFVLRHLAERIELVTSAAVVVANHERLAVYEEAIGLSNSIWTSLIATFVPRILWPEKPTVSDGRAFGMLYFGYSNSYAVTLSADLLRNLGPWSIPIGMAVLGFVLRVLYSALIEDLPVSMWRTTAYLVLLITVSYEGAFGQILPMLLRTGVVLAMCLSLVEGVRRLRWRGASAVPRLR